MWFSQPSLFGALLASAAFSTAAPTESTAARHATVVTRQALLSNYTFIIAGGGIAGLTLADRLTEDPKGKPSSFYVAYVVRWRFVFANKPLPFQVTVLVVEAGPLDAGQDGILVPGAFAPYYYFWPGLATVPQAGLNNRTIGAITAQVVGGGSTINAMVYLR